MPKATISAFLLALALLPACQSSSSSGGDDDTDTGTGSKTGLDTRKVFDRLCDVTARR